MGAVHVNLQTLLRRAATPANLRAVRLGIEREGQRITPTGQLATTDLMPALVAGAPAIQRDFAESQLELVTPVATTTSQAFEQLTTIHRTVYQHLAGELIWPLSTPPALPVNQTNIQIAKLADSGAVAYREHLAQHYGRRRQMISGVHVNVELAPALLTAMFRLQTQEASFTAFRNHVYVHAAQNYLRYRWLMTYLFGCSPMGAANFFAPGAPRPTHAVRSLRNSHYGYHNDAGVRVSYASLAQYLDDLQRLVATNQLSAAKEFYGQVRLRGGHGVLDVGRTGIEYLELRDLDLNPFAPTGITQQQLATVYGFLLLMLWLPAPADSDAAVLTGAQRNDVVALEDPLERTRYQAEGAWLVEQLTAMVTALGFPDERIAVAGLTITLKHPEQTLAAQWRAACALVPEASLALRLAREAAQRWR